MIWLLPLAVAGVAVAGSKTSSRSRRSSMGLGHPSRRPGYGRRYVQRCDPWPWLDAEVTYAVHDAIEAGITDPRAITAEVLRAVYPVTVSGEPVQWPCARGDCDAMRALQFRAEARVRRELADMDDRIAADHYAEIFHVGASVHG